MISARGVSKLYPGKRALDDVTVSFEEGQVTALIGGNGAGKSTLLRILGGAIALSSGTVLVGSRNDSFHSVGQARAAGVWMADQEGSLIPAWSVDEHFRRLAGLLSGSPWRSLLPDIDGPEIIANLPQFQRQLVEIALVSAGGKTAALFDEPTGGQSSKEKQLILEALRNSATGGSVVIWVTHDLDAALAVADRILVLQSGRVVRDIDPSCSTRNDLLSAFVKYEGVPAPVHVSTTEECRLKIFLHSTGEPICIRAGEVLGLVSNGMSKAREALRASVGLGDTYRFLIEPSPPKRGPIAYMSPERDLDWDFAGKSLCFNLTAGLLPKLTRAGIVDRGGELCQAERLKSDFLIDAPSLDTPIEELSGGNRQKALLARLTSMNPEVLVLDEPFSGVDVSTRTVLGATLKRLARGGMAIAIYSHEWEDLIRVVDRLVVVRDDDRLSHMSVSSASVALIENILGGAVSPQPI